jgi:hypothetical protein
LNQTGENRGDALSGPFPASKSNNQRETNIPRGNVFPAILWWPSARNLHFFLLFKEIFIFGIKVAFSNSEITSPRGPGRPRGGFE